jgi:hypothetical protein
MKFFVDEELAVDPGTAFDAMADVRNETQWNGQVTRAEMVSSGSIAKGSRFQTVNRGYEYDAVLTTYERPKRLEFEVTGKQLDISVGFRFEAAGPGRSRMHGEFDMRPKGFMKLLFPLMKPLVRRDFPKQMAGFKGFVEGPRLTSRT